MTRIGAHVGRGDPLAAATDWGADVVQFFLGDPQDWKAPVFPGDPAELRDAFAGAGIGVYIHAPYRIHVATTNNRVRLPSRKLLRQHPEAAAPTCGPGGTAIGRLRATGAAPAGGARNSRKRAARG